MKAVYLEWIDASASGSWEKISDMDGIHECRALGFLVREDSREVILAATVSRDECNASIAIPKAWIKKRKVIKL